MSKCIQIFWNECIKNNKILSLLIAISALLLLYFSHSEGMSAVIGVITGAYIARYYTIIDRKEKYIQNAQNVILLAVKQYNEFENIKKHFGQFQDSLNKTQPLIISETEWRLSKDEILGLNQGDHYIQKIIYDLVFLDKSYKDLVLAVQDHAKYMANQDNHIDSSTTTELLDAIHRRITSINYSHILQELHRYLAEKYPSEKFAKPKIK